MNILPRISDTLYHGTIDFFSSVDVTKGKSNKDFGKGFYMALEKSQAIGMMNKKFGEAVRRTRSKDPNQFSKHLYEIKLNREVIPNLKIKLECRDCETVPHDYDLVIGPTADDNTTLCLKYYKDGVYGKVGSYEAKELLLKNLEVENLGIQYYIGKQEVADKLILTIKEL